MGDRTILEFRSNPVNNANSYRIVFDGYKLDYYINENKMYMATITSNTSIHLIDDFKNYINSGKVIYNDEFYLVKNNVFTGYSIYKLDEIFDILKHAIMAK